MKVLQFSTTWCGPCKVARSIITNEIKPSEESYEWVDVEKPHEYEDILKESTKRLGRGVPQFVTIDKDNQIINAQLGFSLHNLKDLF